MKQKIILTILFIFFLFLDQYTKNIIKQNFYYGESVVVIKNLFKITYVQNKGIAFGMFQRRGFWFLFITPIAIFFVLKMLYDISKESLFLKISSVIIIAGAIGNFIDRIKYGYVIDFLDFFIKKYHWPAFNVADSLISIGIFFILISSFLKKKTEMNDEKN